jgi:ATP-dependent DNA helicase RecG
MALKWIEGPMNLEELRALVAQGESERLDFKKTTGELKAGLQTTCAFLNGSGGKILFGVTDSGVIRGQDITDPTLREVANEIRRLEPPARLEQTRVPVGGTKEVLVVATTDHTHAPYTYDGRPYKRIGSTTSQMPQSEYHDRLLARTHSQHRWENQVAEGYSPRDIDT